MSRLLAVRRLLLYVVSLHALASSRLAWGDAAAWPLIALAVALAVVLVLGESVADLLSGLGTASWRRRARLAVGVGYLFAVFLSLVGASAHPDLAARAVGAMALLHLALLVATEFLGLRALVLANVLLLVGLATLRGGTAAVVAVVGLLALLPLHLAFDRAVRVLRVSTAVDRRLVAVLFRETVRLAWPLAGLVATVLVLWPPRGYSAVALAGPGALAPAPQGAYRLLILLALAGGGLVMGLARLLRGRRRPDDLLIDSPETAVMAEEAIDASAPADEGRYGTGRGRVIRAYVRLLSRAREAGHRVEPFLTPIEIAPRLRAPQVPLAQLTGAFMDARYGPDEPTDDVVRGAERLGQELMSRFRRRLSPKARRG